MQHWGGVCQQSAVKRLGHFFTSAIAISALLISMITPAYAVSSSSSVPALGGLSAAPSAGTETAPMDAALTSPYSVDHVGAGMSPMMQSLASTGPTDPTPTAKFNPPDTPYNGAFTRSIALKVLPFFGHTPKIVFGYNSGDNRMHGGNGFSPLGVGWSLSGGSLIERISAHGGVPKYDSTDAFKLDDDTLLSCTTDSGTRSTPSCNAGGNYTPRFETFQRVSFNAGPNTWTVTDRDGTVSTYQPLASFNPSGSQDSRLRTQYRWLLSTVTDTDGNTETYSYDWNTAPMLPFRRER